MSAIKAAVSLRRKTWFSRISDPDMRRGDPAMSEMIREFSNYLDFSFDPGNKYTIPYQAGTDAIVYNADTVQNPPKSWADLWNPDSHLTHDALESFRFRWKWISQP